MVTEQTDEKRVLTTVNHKPSIMNWELLKSIKIMIRSVYDIQSLRLALGTRLVSNFKKKIGIDITVKEDKANPKIKKLLEKLIAEYKLLSLALTSKTTGKRVKAIMKEIDDESIGKKYDTIDKSIEKRKEFIEKENEVITGDYKPIISDKAEFIALHQFMRFYKMEQELVKDLIPLLDQTPIYSKFLKHIHGIGPVMSGVILSELDPRKANSPSAYFMVCGIDVPINKETGQVIDGRGRSRREEHQVKKKYIDKKGEEKEKNSLTFNPFLKTKILGVLAGSLIKANAHKLSTKKNIYEPIFRNKLNQLEHHNFYKNIPEDKEEALTYMRNMMERWRSELKNGGLPILNFYISVYEKFEKELSEEKKAWKGKITNFNKIRKKHRIDISARYMIKMFLIDLWIASRWITGLIVRGTYAEEKLGLSHHGENSLDRVLRLYPSINKEKVNTTEEETYEPPIEETEEE